VVSETVSEKDVGNRKTVGLVQVVGTKMDVSLLDYHDISILPFLRTLPKVVPNNDRASRVTC